MSEEQEATVLGIIQEANEWFETDRYLELLKNDPDGILEERNADLFKRFEQCLNKSQVKLVRQRVSAFYFTRESKRQLLVMDEGEYLYGTPPWMEKSIAAHIGLEQKSFDKAVSILKSFRKDRVNLYKTHRKNLVSFFAAWNNELQNELGPAQQKKYKSAMGKPIKFPESCESVFDLASAGGPLIFRQQSVNIKVSFTPTSDLFLLAKLESKFNGKYVPEGLLEFLKLPEISSNLELSKEQLSKISEIQKSWREEYPAEKTCLIDNNFGTEPPSAICPEEKTPKMTQLEKLQKRIDNVLTKIQEKRLRQIWNQVVVQFGWKEVPLVHPD